jgi:iron complex transport system ATP-binding protein
MSRAARQLCFDAVAVELGGKHVLRGVSFELRPGEVLGLLGRNGAGKTTLLRAAAGALAPTSGDVRLGGRRLSAYSRRELARAIAVVPQDLHVPFPFRAGELVLMGRAPHQPLFGFDGDRDVSRALTAMERMGVRELADRPIFELSGGERQLVMFARALAQEPELLLLDEPTAFLDLRHRLEVLQVVRELASRGRSALVVSHDLGLAARACDRLLLLADGRVAASGPPREILTPEVLRQVFGIEAELVKAPDGTLLVLPRLDVA